MSQFNAQPIVDIEIYPYEGGSAKYVISSSRGSLLSATVQKKIHHSQPGSFTLELAPGGPGGVNSVKTWTEIITPMSLVIIKASRWTHQNVIMIGLATSIGEEQEWSADRTVERTIVVQGFDFQYFFTQFNYYTLYFLGSTAAAAISQSLGALALPALLGQGVLGGSPDKVGAAWFNTIMAGKSGILANTRIPYENGYISFPDIMQQYYESILSAELTGMVIPMAENFLSSEGTWYDKFTRIFPMPWYEFFVISGPENFYATDKIFSVLANKPLSAFNRRYSPQLVARVLPIPRLRYNALKTLWSMDTSLWDALPQYTLDGHGYINNDIIFDESQARNFYVIQPTTLSTMFGAGGGNISTYLLTFQAAVDTASVHRYGYRPQKNMTYWLDDANGNASVSNADSGANMAVLTESLLTRVVSWYEPTPLMAKAQMTTVFRPDIMPGCKFQYAPFKNTELWEFYITGFTHRYVFGQPTTTTLDLERGLPAHIYAQTDFGKAQVNGTILEQSLLTNIHLGEAMRQQGVYTQGLPPGAGSGIEIITPGNSIGIQGDLAKVFVTAQAS